MAPDANRQLGELTGRKSARRFSIALLLCLRVSLSRAAIFKMMIDFSEPDCSQSAAVRLENHDKGLVSIAWEIAHSFIIFLSSKKIKGVFLISALNSVF